MKYKNHSILFLFLLTIFFYIFYIYQKNKIYDFVIIGGGIGGLNTCYELLKINPNFHICILEKNEKLGGRIQNTFLKNHPVDIGAIRIPISFQNIQNLMKELNLPLRDLDLSLQGSYFNHKWYSKEQLKKQNPNFYAQNINSDERLKQLILQSIEYNINEKNLNPNKIILGKPLKDWGFQALLRQYTSKDELDWLSRTMNFENSIYLSEMSMLTFLHHFDYIDSNLYFTNKPIEYKIPYSKDYSFGLTYSIIEKLDEKTKKTKKILNCEVKECTFENKIWIIEYNKNNSSKNNILFAKNIICCVPPIALSKIKINPIPDPQLWKYLLLSSSPIKLGRIYLKYPYKWWKQTHGSFYDDQTNKMIWIMDPKSNIILASYHDEPHFNFWSGLSKDKILKEAHKGVIRGLGYENKNVTIPKPTDYIYKKWGFDEYAVSLYKPGYIPLEIENISVQPFSNLPLYLVSDILSTKQGWMEGSVLHSNKVIQKIKSNLQIYNNKD